MRIFALILLAAVLLLQFRLWLSGDGVREVQRLQVNVEAQQRENAQLKARNEQLAAEVKDLKEGLDAVEERARSDLGMVGANETFYQVVAPTPSIPGASGQPDGNSDRDSPRNGHMDSDRNSNGGAHPSDHPLTHPLDKTSAHPPSTRQAAAK